VNSDDLKIEMNLRYTNVTNFPAVASSIRLFCFPFAGGGAAAYQGWQRHAPPWLQVCPVELPGRGWLSNAALSETIDELAYQIASSLHKYTNSPYAVFGHSMGAILAYEVARNLEAAGQRQLVKFFPSGLGAPFLPRKRPPISHLPDSEFLEHVRELNGTVSEVFENDELLTVLIPILRADFAMCERYQFRTFPRLRCPITAFSGDRDEGTCNADMLGWSQLTTESFHSLEFSGDHFFIQTTEPQVVDAISKELAPHRNQY
jgi:medium-chain acyl-[acyl-carrier-protein] hydrolase